MKASGTPAGAPGPRADGAGGPPLSRLVVGFDASPPSVRAVRLATELARGGRAHLWLVFAQQPDPRTAEPRTEEEARVPVRATQKAMETLIREALAAGVGAEALVREGEPAAVILRAARELNAGMVLVGTRGLGGAARVLLGSISSRVVSEGSTPVVIVP